MGVPKTQNSLPMPPTRLPFEPFLQRLKLELGYPVDLSKLKQLTEHWLHPENWLDQPIPPLRLFALCRALFLQKKEDAERFEQIFCNYLNEELQIERHSIERIRPATTTTPSNPDSGTGSTSTGGENPRGGNGSPDETGQSRSDIKDDDTPEAEKIFKKKYLHLTIPAEAIAPENQPGEHLRSSRFQLSDAYLPLTHREMVRGWRYLRKKDQYRTGTRLDVPATVRHIAERGMLIEPVFQPEPINSESILLILADRRGSMMPFHRLTDRLIEAARSEGGHRKALVYYFYNCPMGWVYKNPDLTDGVSIAELYSKIRPDQTNTLIISDAGAARGFYNPTRIQNTQNFLFGKLPAVGSTASDGGLQKAALFVSWLNPMPKHRWRGTTAAALASDRLKPLPMFSLMDEGYAAFFKAIQVLMGK